MKISKRQLKRIIREEYTRLKRRGLIRERNEEIGPDDGDGWDDELEKYTSGDIYVDFVDLYHRTRSSPGMFWELWNSHTEDKLILPKHWDYNDVYEWKCRLVDVAYDNGDVDDDLSAASEV